jgi:hypothetical protein
VVEGWHKLSLCGSASEEDLQALVEPSRAAWRMRRSSSVGNLGEMTGGTTLHSPLRSASLDERSGPHDVPHRSTTQPILWGSDSRPDSPAVHDKPAGPASSTRHVRGPSRRLRGLHAAASGESRRLRWSGGLRLPNQLAPSAAPSWPPRRRPSLTPQQQPQFMRRGALQLAARGSCGVSVVVKGG